MEKRKQLDQFLDEIHLNLNEQQRKAMMRTSGQTLLLAVPGSGKTTVIIARTAFMVQVLKIPAKQILSLTFSKSAARDLKERYQSFAGQTENLPYFSTIHAFALSVIRKCERRYKKQAFTILEDNTRLISELYQQIKGQRPSESDLADLCAKITYVKNLRLSKEEIQKIELTGIRFSEFYQKFEALKRKKRLMDFDDLLFYALKLLEKDQALLEYYQKRFLYINIDEAQDTSKIQYDLIRLLAKKAKALFMVGDEDQSIYGFRGAYPEGLLSFQNEYPKGKVLLMETNFRSTKALVRRADRFIQENEGRYDKHIRTDNEKGIDACQEYFKSQEQMYQYVLSCAKRERKDTAVLYRNNESAIPLIDLFEREGVSYRLKEHSPLFFSNFILKDLKDIYAFAQHPDDYDCFSRVYYKLSAAISRENLLKVSRKKGNVLDRLLNSSIPDWLYDQIEDLKEDLKLFVKLKPQKAIRFWIDTLGYQRYIDFRSDNGMSVEYIQQKLDILEALAAREDSLESFFERLSFLEGRVRSASSQDRAQVMFTTMHSAKGLEFDKVLMMDLYENVIPAPVQGSFEEKRKQYLEEVRLFYVGVTRARKELVFLSIGSKRHQPSGKEDSVFISKYLK